MSQTDLDNWLQDKVDRSLAKSSRIHPLPSDASNALYIKREDELSSGVVGSKLRKYASLIPYLKRESYTDTILIGGSNSNNLAGLVQILREHRIDPWLFVRKSADTALKGNALFIKMLCDDSQLIEIERADWPHVVSIAQQRVDSLRAAGKKAFLIPEGALTPQSLPGSLTLPLDILENEREHFIEFTDLFIDSGSGASAIGLILGLALVDPQFDNRRIHISLIAGSPEEFSQNLRQLGSTLPFEIDQSKLSKNLHFLAPPSAKSFGSVNATILETCRSIARTEGILMDPVYSVKHYMAMKQRLPTLSSGAKSLFIYNGGALGLCGFQEEIGLNL
ncbi:MAG: pyridoxal-phosphate dependent enzyme [Verrucomicrobiota bacterium]